MRLVLASANPDKAAEIANGYIDEFRKLSANLAITEASQRRIFFQQQLKEAKENLAAAEEAMKGTEQSTGVFQIDSQTRVLIESAAALRAQIVAKEVQIQGMRSYATEDNPEIFEAKQQLAALQAQLARLADADQDSSSGLIVPKGKVPEAGMEYIRKLRDVKYYDTISELIAKQFEMAKLDEARQGAVIQVVDVAVPPDHRSYPKRTITVILAMVLAFFVACGWGILVARRLCHDLCRSEMDWRPWHRPLCAACAWRPRLLSGSTCIPSGRAARPLVARPCARQPDIPRPVLFTGLQLSPVLCCTFRLHHP